MGHSEVAEALTRGYDEGGYLRAMRLAAEKLAARSKLTTALPTRIAALYAHAGRKDRALDWLETGYEERSPDMPYIGVPPPDLRQPARRPAIPGPPAADESFGVAPPFRVRVKTRHLFYWQ